MLSILQLEDDPVDSQLALRLLKEGGLDVHIVRVHTLEAFLRVLEHNPPALILADYTVPGVNVLRLFQLARQLHPEIPFVFLSGTLGEDVAIETLKMGATDYVLKQRIGRLVPAVRRALQEAKVQAQRKQAEQELRESEGRYRALLETAPDAVVVIQNGRLVYVNAAGLRLCGASTLHEVWGREVSQFVTAPDQELVRCSVQRLMDAGGLLVRELRVLRLDGREVPIEGAGSRIEWLGQFAVQAILRDITERKRNEQELRAAREELLCANARLEQTVRERTADMREAIEDLHRFSYAIIHDMRAPLRAMHSFATLLQRECAGCEVKQRVDYLDRIKYAAERLDSLIQDALNYSKVLQDRLPLAPVDLNRLLRGIIESYPNLQPGSATISIPEALPLVLGTEAALSQCLGNLLDNAVKFVAPGVRPQIQIWAAPLPVASEPPGAPPDSFVRLWIQDNGIGIAPEHQTQIFDMFQRLDPGVEGTGVGLAIVRKAIERVGGRVGVESAVGTGSKFWLDLRRATAAASSPPLPDQPAAHNPSPEGIFRDVAG